MDSAESALRALAEKLKWHHITTGRTQMLVEILGLSVQFKNSLPEQYVEALRHLDPSCQDPKPPYLG